MHQKKNIGEWRSLVAHLTGGQVAAGSNPVSPTIKKSLEFQAFRGFFVLTEIHNIPPNYPCFSLTVVETVVETFAEFMGIHNEYIFIFCIKVFFPLAAHITLSYLISIKELRQQKKTD